jgi:hypothetical protein
MPWPQVQYTNCSCTSRVSSRSTLKSSRREVHGDDPKKPSQPMRKPHSSASHTYDTLETHKVSNHLPVTKMLKPSRLSDDAGPLNDSPRSPRGFSDKVQPIQSVLETNKVSTNVQNHPVSKSIQHNALKQLDRDAQSSLELDMSNIHHIYDVSENHKFSSHALPDPASKPRCDNYQEPSGDLPQSLRFPAENNYPLHQDTIPVLSDAQLQSSVSETTSGFQDPMDAIWAKLSTDVSVIRDELDEARCKRLREDTTSMHKVSQPSPAVVHKTTAFSDSENRKKSNNLVCSLQNHATIHDEQLVIPLQPIQGFQTSQQPIADLHLHSKSQTLSDKNLMA